MCLKWRNEFRIVRGETNLLGKSLGLATKETILKKAHEQDVWSKLGSIIILIQAEFYMSWTH